MCSKAEWKECAERRLAENLALRILINQIGELTREIRGVLNFDTVTQIMEKIEVAKEVGK